MKLCAGLSAAFAGLVAAAQNADVYIVPAPDVSTSASAPTRLSPSMARLVLLQRLSPGGRGPYISDFPKDTDLEQIVSIVSRFGKAPPPLFARSGTHDSSQLVVMLEEMSVAQMDEAARAFKTQPTFSIPNPPGGQAHDDLIKTDLRSLGVVNGNECSMAQAFNPLDECWSGKQAAVVRYKVDKDPDTLSHVLRRLPQLSQLGKAGEMETTFVLLPSTSRASSWSDQPSELRRRQAAERVMASPDKSAQPVAPASSGLDKTLLMASGSRVASCFTSQEGCVTATGNCSGHGTCLNKYPKEENSCFACHCLSTRTKSGSLTHWAGATCSKRDVSMAFWLFAGFTVALVSVLWMAIYMLFDVGQEKLPGVIGAGVSRSK
ncbi:hypothetical protein CDD81_82 [Ophiocordyceps australis]|uniref:Vacuolar sorting protein Vps3844 C-terminal domain-containing protein n=1 Tax=Ophiocordyceps australis TaxID=1399860 RepID=A0A2C5XCH8_9HYPO|nr:hypothetical protein CDD81_82 [Ophiocordyceps australis]